VAYYRRGGGEKDGNVIYRDEGVQGETFLTNEEWCLQVVAPISSVYKLCMLPTDVETDYGVRMWIYTQTALDTHTHTHTIINHAVRIYYDI
jgi:hypothetical protein